MTKKKKLFIAILYHHHQPYYKDTSTNYYQLPWVRFHAIKDYYDMAAIVENFENLKLNFNLVPSLMLQLEDYANNAIDKYLQLTLKPADQLNHQEKLFILKEFFKCNWQTMVYPYKRYAELLEKRGKVVSDEELERKIKYFSTQDFLDLQMLSNLVWFDPYWRNKDPEIKFLFDKQQGYTQQEKELVVKKQRYICGEIVKLYKRLQDEGKIEVTTSAFYHPILPLLCDFNKAKISNPQITLPSTHFIYPEDAKKQIETAIEYYIKQFGVKPKGFWPSEGAVSDDIIPFLVDVGIKWIATDEEILKNSLQLDPAFRNTKIEKKLIYKNYKVSHPSGKEINIIFRDRELSDNIGFVYSNWDPKDAVKDIELRLNNIYHTVYSQESLNEDYIVSIILDGENCWEYYPNDGIEFLTEFYKMLTTNELFETTLISKYIEEHPAEYTLKTLWPGSWINANYNIWIGHPEDNTAWEYLTKTRNVLVENINSQPQLEKEKIESCWEEIYIAEGSDWYWWYGDEHFTLDSSVFDNLFRQHLKNVYIQLGLEIPQYLNIPIKGSGKKPEYVLPTDFISPVIDGKITNYFEWISAGKYLLRQTSSMHQTTNIISQIFFGFDLGNLYFRIDLNPKIEKENLENLLININLLRQQQLPETFNITFYLADKIDFYEFYAAGLEKQILNDIKKDKIIELKLPFCLIKTLPGNKILFNITVYSATKGNKEQTKLYELERWPPNGYIEIFHPTESYPKQFWSV